MAAIKAFTCIRPKQELADQIAALPYDVYNRKEALEVVNKQPLSFLRIDRAETQFGEEVASNEEQVYQKAHDLLWEMVEKGQMQTDNSPGYFIYELTMNGRSQTGLAACASIDDYQNNVIKKHENTREEKESDRIRHVDVCNAQTGPIFLAYRSNACINGIVAQNKQETPIYDFTADDGVSHRVWKISDSESIAQVEQEFEKIQDIYIADGHHRAASAVKVGLKRRSENPGYTGAEEFNFFLSVLFPDEELYIMPYNRVVKDLNGMDAETFLQELNKNFTVEKKGKEPYAPEEKGCFGMYLEENWYKVSVPASLKTDDPVKGLDVSILQEEILRPMLHIEDPRVDHRIDFIGGIRGLKELERRVHEDMKVAFSMYPTSIQELFAVADADRLMPPKSTWFEPKLRSGLFIHGLD